jgi:hypothetical protein
MVLFLFIFLGELTTIYYIFNKNYNNNYQDNIFPTKINTYLLFYLYTYDLYIKNISYILILPFPKNNKIYTII